MYVNFETYARECQYHRPFTGISPCKYFTDNAIDTERHECDAQYCPFVEGNKKQGEVDRKEQSLVRVDKLKVVFINGYGKVGKDTVVDYIAEMGYRIANVDSVRKEKGVAKIFGWDGEKSDISREALSELKKLSAKYFDSPVKTVVADIERADREGKDIAFVHIREIAEIERVKALIETMYDICTVLVTNKNLEHIPNNSSDLDVMNYKYDYVIENDDTLEVLKEKTNLFVEKMLK